MLREPRAALGADRAAAGARRRVRGDDRGLGPSGRRHSEADLRLRRGDGRPRRARARQRRADVRAERAEEQLGAVVQRPRRGGDGHRRERPASSTPTTPRWGCCGPAAPSELLARRRRELMDRFEVYDEDGRPSRSTSCPAARACRRARRRADAGAQRREARPARSAGCSTRRRRSRGADGAVRGVVNVIEDVTRGQARRAARSGCWPSASEALASSLDYESTLQRVAERGGARRSPTGAASTCPAAAAASSSVALVHTRPGEGRARRASCARRYPVRIDDDRSGSPRCCAAAEPRSCAARSTDEELRAVRPRRRAAASCCAQLGIGSVDRRAARRPAAETLGTLIARRRADRLRAFGDAGRSSSREELGRRAGTAVLNARMYTRARGDRGDAAARPAAARAARRCRAARRRRSTGRRAQSTRSAATSTTSSRPPDGWMLVIGDVAGQRRRGGGADRRWRASRCAPRPS